MMMRRMNVIFFLLSCIMQTYAMQGPAAPGEPEELPTQPQPMQIQQPSFQLPVKQSNEHEEKKEQSKLYDTLARWSLSLKEKFSPALEKVKNALRTRTPQEVVDAAFNSVQKVEIMLKAIQPSLLMAGTSFATYTQIMSSMNNVAHALPTDNQFFSLQRVLIEIKKMVQFLIISIHFAQQGYFYVYEPLFNAISRHQQEYLFSTLNTVAKNRSLLTGGIHVSAEQLSSITHVAGYVASLFKHIPTTLKYQGISIKMAARYALSNEQERTMRIAQLFNIIDQIAQRLTDFVGSQENISASLTYEIEQLFNQAQTQVQLLANNIQKEDILIGSTLIDLQRCIIQQHAAFEQLEQETITKKGAAQLSDLLMNLFQLSDYLVDYNPLFESLLPIATANQHLKNFINIKTMLFTLAIKKEVLEKEGISKTVNDWLKKMEALLTRSDKAFMEIDVQEKIVENLDRWVATMRKVVFHGGTVNIEQAFDHVKIVSENINILQKTVVQTRMGKRLPNNYQSFFKKMGIQFKNAYNQIDIARIAFINKKSDTNIITLSCLRDIQTILMALRNCADQFSSFSGDFNEQENQKITQRITFLLKRSVVFLNFIEIYSPIIGKITFDAQLWYERLKSVHDMFENFAQMLVHTHINPEELFVKGRARIERKPTALKISPGQLVDRLEDELIKAGQEKNLADYLGYINNEVNYLLARYLHDLDDTPLYEDLVKFYDALNAFDVDQPLPALRKNFIKILNELIPELQTQTVTELTTALINELNAKKIVSKTKKIMRKGLGPSGQLKDIYDLERLVKNSYATTLQRFLHTLKDELLPKIVAMPTRNLLQFGGAQNSKDLDILTKALTPLARWKGKANIDELAAKLLEALQEGEALVETEAVKNVFTALINNLHRLME